MQQRCGDLQEEETARDFFKGQAHYPLVFLPLLPNRGYGLWETLNPYWTWWTVVLISGLSFVGYVVVQFQLDSLALAARGIILACATNTLAKGLLFAGIAGFRQHFRLPLRVCVAMLPGLLLA